MKKKIVLSVGLVITIILSMAIGAYAASNTEEIKVLLNKSLKVKVNGELLAVTDSSGKPAYPITYNGTTYLPVRSVGESVGLKVGFDSNSNTVLLGEDKPATPASNTGLSRSNPAPIGTMVTSSIKNLLDDYQATFKVEQVVRGDEAWTMIQQANMFNSAPADGYEYMLVKLSVGITKNANPDAKVDINGVSFTLVSESGKDYDYVSVVAPEPKLNANLYVGASNTGWAVYQVKTDDANPLLSFGRKYDGTGGVWLKVN